MPVIIGMLGSIVTILWILYRLAEMGITLGGLNPFLWRRRRAWRQKYEANPLFSLTEPLDVTALLAVATAKADGDMSAAERHALLADFEKTFSLNARKASELLTASVHSARRRRVFATSWTSCSEVPRALQRSATRVGSSSARARRRGERPREPASSSRLPSRVRAVLSPELSPKVLGPRCAASG
jgi:hypothetical protein